MTGLGGDMTAWWRCCNYGYFRSRLILGDALRCHRGYGLYSYSEHVYPGDISNVLNRNTYQARVGRSGMATLLYESSSPSIEDSFLTSQHPFTSTLVANLVQLAILWDTRATRKHGDAAPSLLFAVASPSYTIW